MARVAVGALIGILLWPSMAAAQSNLPGAFVADPGTGCKVWNPHPLPDETASWSGNCVNGLADGTGTLRWLRGGRIFEKDDGGWKAGRQEGRGTQDWYTGRYEGTLASGEPEGYGILTLQAARYEGQFRKGKPYGEGTLVTLQGVAKGVWIDGCLTDNGRKFAFAVAPSACR
ncbi:hypothetical protein [Bradyrhizobium sp. STM 3809]|uniref:hypothetical protein n=1 Tax=Bradyrhizobium sp. STM 3809 TaxID=551936 RepID=UPI000240A283|nr:hypothetical protein [Bradyrhizobium sp. STM 3809]CCE02197.1 conserved exported hypothetical protein [Bradyrhizobium sp. STM 3809]